MYKRMLFSVWWHSICLRRNCCTQALFLRHLSKLAFFTLSCACRGKISMGVTPPADRTAQFAVQLNIFAGQKWFQRTLPQMKFSAQSVNSYLSWIILGITTTWYPVNQISHSWQKRCFILRLQLLQWCVVEICNQNTDLILAGQYPVLQYKASNSPPSSQWKYWSYAPSCTCFPFRASSVFHFFSVETYVYPEWHKRSHSPLLLYISLISKTKFPI